MNKKISENWKEYLIIGLIGVWIIVFFVIFYISAEAGCNPNAAIAETEGICLARSIAGLSCFAGYLGVWTVLGTVIAMRKGRNPWLGFILGLTLEFMGCFGLMTLEPRRDAYGRMIHWNEYKKMSQEQKDATSKAADPLPGRKRLVFIVLMLVLLFFLIVTALNNLGKI